MGNVMTLYVHEGFMVILDTGGKGTLHRHLIQALEVLGRLLWW